VDRSAGSMARYVAKNIVAAKLAEERLVQVGYCIECHGPEDHFPRYEDGMNHQQGHMEYLLCHTDHTKK